MALSSYNDSVFVNCPFDIDYLPMLRAIIYAIYRCGFVPYTALNEDNATDYRLDKIIRCIKQCRYGIHDISRTELNSKGLPRFNMPFELGIFFGAKQFGIKEQRNKNGLVFERKKYAYQQYLSDLNGVDVKAHGNKPLVVIESIRTWLQIASRRSTIPGTEIIKRDFKDFIRKLPTVAKKIGLNPKNIPFNDYCLIVEEVIMYRQSIH